MRYKIGTVKLGNLGDDTTGSTDTSGSSGTTTDPFANILTSLTSAGTSLLNVYNQQQLNSINIQRAAQGLAPLPASTIGPTATIGLSSDVQNILIYGGLGFAALFLINALLKR